MEILRTPDSRFADLPDFPYAPHYAQVGDLRIHYIDEGLPDASPVLLMHGEPSWSFRDRHMIPVLVAAGHRPVAPDLVGFGRSDKPADRGDYTYQRHVDWIRGWLDAVDLQDITLVCQDWGALIGLRLVADQPERFARVVVGNGALPTGEGRPPFIFRAWQAFARWSPWFPADWIVAAGCRRRLSSSVRAAYRAPFPDARYKQGARVFPALVPLKPDDPGAAENRRAWERLRNFEKPFLTAFSDGDPIMRGLERRFQREIPGAEGQPHTTIRDAGHFLQEDRGPELARVVVDFIAAT